MSSTKSHLTDFTRYSINTLLCLQTTINRNLSGFKQSLVAWKFAQDQWSQAAGLTWPLHAQVSLGGCSSWKQLCSSCVSAVNLTVLNSTKCFLIPLTRLILAGEQVLIKRTDINSPAGFGLQASQEESLLPSGGWRRKQHPSCFIKDLFCCGSSFKSLWATWVTQQRWALDENLI